MTIEKFDATKCAWHEKDIKDMKKVLYGNGEGFIKEVTTIKALVKVILGLLIPTFGGMLALLIRILVR